MKVTNNVNAGVLIESTDKKILIDGLVDREINLWEALNYEEVLQIKQNNYPYNQIDLLIVTHTHEDHFSKDLTCIMLQNNPDLVLLTIKDVIMELKSSVYWKDVYAKQLIETCPQYKEVETLYIKGICVDATYLVHDGEDYKDVEQICVAINLDGMKIIHLADAEAHKKHFESLDLIKDVDLAILNFPYLCTINGIRLINQMIKPTELLIVHIPKENKDPWQTQSIIKKNKSKLNENIKLFNE